MRSRIGDGNQALDGAEWLTAHPQGQAGVVTRPEVNLCSQCPDVLDAQAVARVAGASWRLNPRLSRSTAASPLNNSGSAHETAARNSHTAAARTTVDIYKRTIRVVSPKLRVVAGSATGALDDVRSASGT